MHPNTRAAPTQPHAQPPLLPAPLPFVPNPWGHETSILGATQPTLQSSPFPFALFTLG